MTTTQPSSTPITAEGAVSLLRDQLDTAILYVADGGGDTGPMYAALAATESAAIQPACGETLTLCVPSWQDRARYDKVQIVDGATASRYMQAEITDLRNSFAAITAYLRAPQDAKAEQAGEYPGWHKVGHLFQHGDTGRELFVSEFDLANGFEARNPRLNRVGALYKPAPASSVTGAAVIDLDNVSMNALREAARQSNWMPPEYMANDWISDCCEWLRNGPPVTTKPASTAPATGSIAADAEFKRLMSAIYSAEDEFSRKARTTMAYDGFEKASQARADLVAYIDARQSVAAPDSARDAALEEAAQTCEALAPHDEEGPDGTRREFEPTQSDCVDAIRALKAVQGKASDADIDYSLVRGDTVYNPRWGKGVAPLEVIDTNWALRAVAVKLGRDGAIVVWPAEGLQRNPIAAHAQQQGNTTTKGN